MGNICGKRKKHRENFEIFAEYDKEDHRYGIGFTYE